MNLSNTVPANHRSTGPSSGHLGSDTIGVADEAKARSDSKPHILVICDIDNGAVSRPCLTLLG